MSWAELWSNFKFTPQLYLDALIRLVLAFLITLPIAIEREHNALGPGLRTFPLIAVASCGYVVVAMEVLSEAQDGAQARIIQGLMSGMGFLGGGAILKSKDTIHGTATAASVWATGAVGASVGFWHPEIGLFIVLVNFITLRLLRPVMRLIPGLSTHSTDPDKPPDDEGGGDDGGDDDSDDGDGDRERAARD